MVFIDISKSSISNDQFFIFRDWEEVEPGQLFLTLFLSEGVDIVLQLRPENVDLGVQVNLKENLGKNVFAWD